VVKEGDEARAAVAEDARRTTSRRELAATAGFDQVSPEVGALDTDAFDQLLDNDADAALGLLAAMAGATDEGLRELARALAGRILVDVARIGVASHRGVGRMSIQSARTAMGDLDLDASADAIVAARAAGRPLQVDDLSVAAWRRPSTALCLLVDRSGSMHGERLAAATIAAAAVAYRAGDDCSIVAFAEDAVVVEAQNEHRAVDDVVSDLLRLRGHGTTDVGLALRVAARQLDRSRAGRKVAVLLSDCRVTAGGDPTADAAHLAELAVIAPADDLDDARRLAGAVGARCVGLSGPSGVPAAVADALA
jgi:Mg-chelatase subunit ChlD